MLPCDGGVEAEGIKKGGKTIEDKKFYQGFFEEIEREIESLTVQEVRKRILI